MMAFRVAAKAARLAGSFSTSSAARAWSAEIGALAAEVPGFCAEDGAGRPRRKAHRMMRMTRSSSGNDHRYRRRVNAISGMTGARLRTANRCESLRRGKCNRRGPLSTNRAKPYSRVMHGFLTVLVGILMLATLGVLIAGMVGMVREGNPRRSNKLMQWRVLLQGPRSCCS